MGRLVGEHARPPALGAVDRAVVDVAADARLEHHLGQLTLEQMVLRRPPRPDVAREDGEGLVDRSVDDDRRPDGRARCGRGHELSSSRWSAVSSTAFLNASSAPVQNWSKYARTASIPEG